MNKRVIAAVAAGVLALLGVLVLVVWAQGANKRAFEGAELVPVVRITKPVAQGATAAELAGSTEVAKLPAEAVPEGAVTSLSQVSGLSTNATLSPGEVLLKARMVAPGDRGKGNTDVPKGYQELSLSLDSQHAAGGTVKAGDRVGIIASFEPKDGKDSSTNVILHDVLITKITSAAEVKDLTSIMVTVAVETEDAERIVFASDFGRVWLTLQNEDTNKTGEKVITAKDVLG
ncbi:MAG: Flp pilus assembly protein CpaB [Aeromicrobium sp.]